MAAPDALIPSPSPRDEPNAALLGGLVADGRELIDAHAAQLHRELGELGHAVQRGAITLAAVVLTGLLIAQALVLGLGAATGLPPWASHAIVGAAIGLAGYGYRRSSRITA